MLRTALRVPVAREREKDSGSAGVVQCGPGLAEPWVLATSARMTPVGAARPIKFSVSSSDLVRGPMVPRVRPALDDTGGANVFLSRARDRDPECRAEHGFAMTTAANLM